MIRRVAPQAGVDCMVSPSWNGRRLSSPVARQGRALARGLDGCLPFQHPHANDRDSWRSRCPQYFPLALKHGICRKSNLLMVVFLQLRIGICTGPVIAGVIGHNKFIYDLWGDSVNTASRMESQGEPGRTQVAATTYEFLRARDL